MIATRHGARPQLIDRVLAVTDHRKPRFFAGGFGDRAALAAALQRFAEPAPSPAITIAWGPAVVGRHATERDGSFESPAASELPTEAKRAIVRGIFPKHGATGRAVVWLAATNDEGWTMRRNVALPLAREGITSLLLENPYYGARRPHGQRRADLATVVDQATMNGATILEARALLDGLARDHAKLVVAGFSMGGQMAALVATSHSGPLGTVAIAAGETAVPIFLEGVLSRAVHWDVLAREAGSLDRARAQLAAVFEAASLGKRPPPSKPEAALIVAGERDGYVSADSVERLHAHWPGSELRWLPAGHASSYLFHKEAWRQAVRDSFRRLTIR
jgi:pimeloyl-ACP methyl ester carboxylesterase